MLVYMYSVFRNFQLKVEVFFWSPGCECLSKVEAQFAEMLDMLGWPHPTPAVTAHNCLHMWYNDCVLSVAMRSFSSDNGGQASTRLEEGEVTSERQCCT